MAKRKRKIEVQDEAIEVIRVNTGSPFLENVGFVTIMLMILGTLGGIGYGLYRTVEASLDRDAEKRIMSFELCVKAHVLGGPCDLTPEDILQYNADLARTGKGPGNIDLSDALTL